MLFLGLQTHQSGIVQKCPLNTSDHQKVRNLRITPVIFRNTFYFLKTSLMLVAVMLMIRGISWHGNYPHDLSNKASAQKVCYTTH